MSKLIDVSMAKEIREELLELLKEAGDIGLSDKVISLAFKEISSANERLVRDALSYLIAKGLIIKTSYKNERLGIGKEIYKISAKGIDVLDGSIDEIGLGI